MITKAQQDALIDAVRKVGREVVMPRFARLDGGEIEEKSSASDLVTIADKESEAALGALIRDILPEAEIVGEEAVAEDASVLDRIDTAKQVAIIDPIDGTWNFAHGLGSFGIILAVAEEGVTQFGVIHDPVADRWIYAGKGEGAWRAVDGGTPQRLALTPGCEKIGDAIGFFVARLFPRKHLKALFSVMSEIGTARSLGASAQEYRLLAEGAVDFAQNAQLNAWDHAAGVLIYQEAGGIARLLDGRDYAPALRRGHLLVARNEALWRDVAGRVTRALEDG